MSTTSKALAHLLGQSLQPGFAQLDSFDDGNGLAAAALLFFANNYFAKANRLRFNRCLSFFLARIVRLFGLLKTSLPEHVTETSQAPRRFIDRNSFFLFAQSARSIDDNLGRWQCLWGS